MNLIANKSFRHGKHSLKSGDAFSAHPVVGQAYCTTGYARVEMGAPGFQDEPDGGEQAYETRVMVAGMPQKRKRGRPRKDQSN